MSEKKVVAISGYPGNGKSYLAVKLRDTYDFRVISLDRLYVDFIHARFPELYFPFLRSFVGPHFDAIVKPGVEIRILHDDVVAAWRDHVCAIAEATLDQYNATAVEGYLLAPLQDNDYERLKKKARVIRVMAKDKHYFLGDKELTIADIARM